ncbi:mechanosensitive ion channel [Marivibrio halodurans]|uniref:Small-conductance mechanosensitive channel n=1 Tax=Marivibrio halodurans TaxID=2039722 RepID=A0A8J7S1A3_9PROT|nr:mechanosensitive ion channel domain-containing protein [Marivibrio halodurans]MBP5858512.1 mechanosensitive ion channel [Marivibrio halodurans]
MDVTAKQVQELYEQLMPMVLDYGENIVSAILILIVGYWVANRLSGGMRRLVDRQKRLDATVKPLLANLVKYTVIAITVIAVLNRFGVQTASIIAVVGAAGLAIGLALQGTLQNIAAGIMLLGLRPFKVGEYIQAGSLGGTVEEIGLFTTTMTTADGVYISAPNSSLWNQAITNYSRNATRRLDFEVGISYDDDIAKAQAALMSLMQSDPRIKPDPAPMTMVTALADSSVNINMRCWISTADFWAVKWDMQKGAKKAVEDVGCTIPFPQRDLHMIEAKG